MTARTLVFGCLAVLVVLFCSCTRQEEGQRDKQAKATQESRAIRQPRSGTPTASPSTEQYEKVTASDRLVFAVMDFSGAQEIGEGGVRIPGGTFGQLLCNQKPVAVSHNRIDAGFITTRDYGKLKVAISTFGELTVYLTPTQKKQFSHFKEKTSAQSKPTAQQAPSVDQIKRDLHGQSVVFKKGFLILNPGDSMGIGPESVRDIKIQSTKPAGETVSVHIAFEFVGVTLGGEKQWLKASGNVEYKQTDGTYEFVKFFGVYPAQTNQ